MKFSELLEGQRFRLVQTGDSNWPLFNKIYIKIGVNRVIGYFCGPDVLVEKLSYRFDLKIKRLKYRFVPKEKP